VKIAQIAGWMLSRWPRNFVWEMLGSPHDPRRKILLNRFEARLGP
jgi:hypothetical protein